MCTDTPACRALLPSLDVAASAARDWALSSSCLHRHPELVDDVQLLVSELVTNAVVHGAQPIVLSLEWDDSGLLCAVRDGSPALPVTREAPVDAVDGRGLHFIESVAAAWGVRPADDAWGLGKSVWFTLPGS